MPGQRISLKEAMGGGYDGGLFTNKAVFPCRYRVYYGGRNTKKSEDIMGREPLFKIMRDPVRNILMLRQNDVDNAQSTYANLVAIIGRLGLTGFRCYTSPHMIVYQPTGQKIVFRGFNNATSLASIKFEKGLLTDIYIEEASEIASEDDFRVLDGSLRAGAGELPPGIQQQITLCLNPWNKEHWIYHAFVEGRMPDDFEYLLSHDYRECYDPSFTRGYGMGLYLHQSTYKINEFRDKRLDADTLLLLKRAPEIAKVEKYGMWGNSTCIVYPEWTPTLVSPRAQVTRQQYDSYAIGIDTGYSDGQGSVRRDGSIKSATVAVLVGLTSDCSRFVALDEWFFSNQTADKEKTMPEIVEGCAEAIERWKDQTYFDSFSLMKGMIPVYVDSADKAFPDMLPKAAQKVGLYNLSVQGSTKLPIQARVDFERLLMGWGDLEVSEACPNLQREFRDSRRGEKGVARQDDNDHATNAFEYGWAALRQRMKRWKTFKVR